MIKVLMKQIGRYKKPSILAPVFSVLEVLMEILIPITMASLIDRGIESGNMTHVYQCGLIMALLAVLGLILGAAAGKYAADASTGFACNLREGMYRNIQTFSFSNIDKYSTAGMVTRLTTDVTNVQNAYQMILRMCTRAPVMLIGALCMSFAIHAKLSLIFVAAIFVLGVCLALIMKSAMGLFSQVFKKYDDLNASVQENVSAIRVVKAFVREDYENTKFMKAADHVYRLFVKAESNLAFNNPVMMLAVYGSILGLSWLGAQMIAGGSLTTGELTSLFSYVMSIMISLMMISMVFVMITMSLASAGRIADILNENTDLKNPSEPVREVKTADVEFDHVSFSYKVGNTDGSKGEGNVLQDICLSVKAGEMIGIIGGTGSAKSSLVNLISRLYDATQGTVRVGGVDVQSYDLDTLRRQVAVVLQNNVLFSGTILENLRWGDPKAGKEACVHAAKLASAEEFIQKLPEKYETYIEQGGSNVSGGQRQRLCIARALIGKPRILILDDSTSAVDTATDAKIRKALREEIPDTTKFIIAQRISSVQDADRILVMDDGVVSGFDTHERLLESNEIYREVYQSQMQGTGDFDQNGGAA